MASKTSKTYGRCLPSALSLVLATILVASGCGSSSYDDEGEDQQAPLEVYCDLDESPYEHCSCVSNGGTGDPNFKGSTCSVAFEHDEESPLICADSDYPRSGKCDYYTGGFWICNGSVHDCQCMFKTSERVGSGITLDCNNSGSPRTHCCHGRYGCECDTMACDADAIEVDDCSSYEELGIEGPPRTCAAGRHEVRTCQFVNSEAPPVGGCVNDSDCPGDCSIGATTSCCPICNSSGACTTVCCTSSGCF
jgi:hypothetical protein